MQNSADLQIGDIFEVLINGVATKNRLSVITGLHKNSFITMSVFEDEPGKRNFRPGAGGTAGPENIGNIVGHMDRDEINRLLQEANGRLRERK